MKARLSLIGAAAGSAAPVKARCAARRPAAWRISYARRLFFSDPG
jgi:hypothetical protein